MQLDLGLVSDRLVEADALRCIGACIVQSSLCKAEGGCNNQAAFELKLLHEKFPAHAGLAQTHVLGENYVVEELVNERNSLLTNLVEMADGEAGGVVGNEPQRVLVVLVGRIFVLCYNHGVDGEATQGNPGLLAVQQIGAVGLLLGNAGHGVVV